MPVIEQTLIRLAMRLQEKRQGLTIKEMSVEIGVIKASRPVTRATVAKYRNDLQAVFGERYLETEGEDGYLRCRLVAAGNDLVALSKEDFAELHNTIAEAKAGRLAERAQRLTRVAEQLQSLLPQHARRTLTVDLPDLLAAEGYALRPGPRPRINHEVLAAIREALTSFKVIRITYRSRRDGKLRTQAVKPHGLIFGNRHYLVAYGTSASKPYPHNYALGNVTAVEITDQVFERDPEFDINNYAANSFGIWQEPPSDVLLRFDANRVDDIADFFFHPTQTISTLDDGRVEVRFRASGLQEIAWHLFTHAPHVDIVAPEALREQYRRMLQAALDRLGPESEPLPPPT